MSTITQRIQLVGGDEIKTAFDALGKAGADAFKQIQTAAGAVTSIKNLAPTLDQLTARIKAVSTAGKQFGNDFDNLGSSLRSTATRVAAIGATVIGAAVGFGLLEKSASDATQAIERDAAAVGVTAQQLQLLQFAAAQSGVATDQLQTGLARLDAALGTSNKSALTLQKAQKDLSDSYIQGKVTAEAYLEQSQKLTKNSDEQITAFSQLGIATHNADGSLRSTSDVLLDVADAFQKMPDGANKSALALQLFGKSGTGLISFLDQGSKGIAAFQAQQEKLAPALTQLQLDVGNKLNNAFDVLTLAVTRAKDSVLLMFAPLTTRLVEAFSEFIGENRTALIQLAGTIADQVTPAVNGLIALLQGDLKTDTLKQIHDDLVEVGTAASQTFSIVSAAVSGILAVFDGVAKAINAVFGTDLNGVTIALVTTIGKLTGAFGVIGSIIKTAISGFGLFGKTAALVFSPEGLILVGIGLLIAAIIAIIAHLPEIEAALQSVSDKISAWEQAATDAFNSVRDTWNEVWTDMADFAEGIVSRVSSFLQPIIDTIRNVSSAISSLGSGGGDTGDTQGFASGGLVRGPGTGRSDSILARISNGEYVIPERAVNFFGLPFLETIRRLGDPLKALGPRFADIIPALMSSLAVPHFASGGLVSSAISTGGFGGSGRSLTIVLNGQSFSNLTGPDDVLDRLGHAAVRAQLKSPGRKPSWYR